MCALHTTQLLTKIKGEYKLKRANDTNKSAFRVNWKILITALSIFTCAFLALFFIGGFFSDSGSLGFSDGKDSQRINLLIAGMDPDGLRTDFLAIASYNTATEKADILTIPENTRMFVGGRYQKISAAHAIYENGEAKGILGTVEALNRLTAIPLNFYVEFSIGAFADLVDEFDNVEFDISENMAYRDKAQDLNINLKKGYQRLNGKKATHLLRYTSYDGGEEKRTAVQQEFMRAFAEQKLNPEYVAKLPELFKKLDLKSNLTAEDIIKYSNILLKLSAEDLTFHTLPGHQEEPGITYWIADTEAQKELTETVFGYNPEKITIEKTKKQ